MIKTDKVNFLLFVSGQAITLTFITLLQMTPLWLFIPLLIAMHMGIALFIISKKRFLSDKRDVKPYYKRIYLLLVLYLPVLSYKLLGRLWPYEANQTWITTGTLIITGVCVIAFIINNLAFRRDLNR